MSWFGGDNRWHDYPEEPQSHYHLLALDVRVIDFVDDRAAIPARLQEMAEDYGARRFAVKHCWSYRCSA